MKSSPTKEPLIFIPHPRLIPKAKFIRPPCTLLPCRVGTAQVHELLYYQLLVICVLDVG
jgi:hypothetical protein